MYCCLHLILIKQFKQSVQFFLTENDDSCIIRIIFIGFIHGCCTGSQRAILYQFHRSDSKMFPLLACTVTFLNKFPDIFCPFKKALFIVTDVQLSSVIQCLECIHRSFPVFPWKGSQVIRLYPCKSTFI